MEKKIIQNIKKIQEKPEEEKMRIVWFMSIFFMILIIGGWFSSFQNDEEDTQNDINNIKLLPFPDIETELSSIDTMVEKIDDIKTDAIGSNEQIEIEEIAGLYIKKELSEEVYNNLRIKQIKKQESNWHLEYQQIYKDLLIEENIVSLIVNDSEKKVTDITSSYDNDINIKIIPNIEVEEAHEIITTKLKNDNLEFKISSLIIYKNILTNPAEYYLTWNINVISEPFQNDYYYIDAEDGEVLHYYSLDK